MTNLIDSALRFRGLTPECSPTASDDLSMRRSPDANRSLGRRAVVIGAGIGGLSAAGALARHFEEVVILERDNLPSSAMSRSGTPQDRHPHGLLAGGLRALDEIFPSFERELETAGAVPVRIARDTCFERADVGLLPQRDFGIVMLCASRPLIELTLRQQVEAIANVRLRPQSRATGIEPLTSEASLNRVRFIDASGCLETIEADLVVDASGRAAPTLALLDAAGQQRPEVTEIGVDLTYSTAVVPIPEDATDDWKLVMTQPAPPSLALHAVLAPAEDRRWIIAIAEHNAATWVDSWEAFLDLSCSLITRTVYNALRHAKPSDSIRHYRFPASTWKHFERLPGLPRGVLPLADSLCRFNPIHAQGMSSAAQQARLLQDVLRGAATAPDPIAALQAGFMAQVALVLESPWALSTSADLAFPATRGERPDNFADAQRFEAALFSTAMADPLVHRTVLAVGQLLQHHRVLHEPEILRRVEAVDQAPVFAASPLAWAGAF
jgi:2-polyprenyl-6-methoxyphenol hydroxylase-like FAD-dependent oxidoreductase